MTLLNEHKPYYFMNLMSVSVLFSVFFMLLLELLGTNYLKTLRMRHCENQYKQLNKFL